MALASMLSKVGKAASGLTGKAMGAPSVGDSPQMKAPSNISPKKKKMGKIASALSGAFGPGRMGS